MVDMVGAQTCPPPNKRLYISQLSGAITSLALDVSLSNLTILLILSALSSDVERFLQMVHVKSWKTLKGQKITILPRV